MQKKLSSVGLVLLGMMAMQASAAAPPRHPQGQIAWQGRPQMQMQVRSQTAAPVLQQAAPQHLDLRPPAHMPQADDASEPGFPTKRASLSAQNAVRLPELGTESARARPTVQEFVRRVHHEGLPLARLYEGRSALVHLGLNPKGKPGLWLVQKIR